MQKLHEPLNFNKQIAYWQFPQFGMSGECLGEIEVINFMTKSINLR